MATKSNLHYVSTDCPTREKLGWANDAQASIEQFLTNFNMSKLLEKWFTDILDAMNEKGGLPGIIPTSGWGYEWGNGLVSEGILFEIPYRLYLHTGNLEIFKKAIPYFKRNLKFAKSNFNEEGLIEYGLGDWAGPFEGENLSIAPTPVDFVCTVMYIKCLKIAIFGSNLLGLSMQELETELSRIKTIFIKEYSNFDGTCKVDEQTAISMLIYHDIYEDITPLKNQLEKQVKYHNYHIYCGMVGMRHLFHSLSKCGLYDCAYKIITSRGYPSYAYWIENGANTLWECWNGTNSHNHHMYSDILSWLMKTVVGISPTFDDVAYKVIDIKPIFFDEMSYANGSIKTPYGIVKVSWKRVQSNIKLKISVPNNTLARVSLTNSFVYNNANNFTLTQGDYNLDIK